MNIELLLAQAVSEAVKMLYNQEITINDIQIQKTKREFEGDLTVMVFSFVKISRKTPEQTCAEIGTFLKENTSFVTDFNIVKGFLNISINQSVWIEVLNKINKNNAAVGVNIGDSRNPRLNQQEVQFKNLRQSEQGLMMIEYSSPNTNKPLHLGHIRNNLLGYSIAEIQKANGWQVVKTNIVNDRGIHICKSMLAWQLFGNGETPETSGMKGDHLVGKFYVEFDKHYKEQIKALVCKGMTEDEAKKSAPLIIQAQEMLFKWENGDKAVRDLWTKMNGWVYAGFDETYKKLGVDFDKIYYESDTYIVGKQEVERGLAEGIFYKRADGSVWADLTADGLDEKLLLRADGTSVYMTQDIGTAKLRYTDFPISKMVYVVGNEQNYHFQVLSLLLDKLGFAWGKSLVHFSYGMVELPEGKMKSREGTVVDADDLVEEMVQTAKETALELGKLDGLNEQEIDEIARIVGLGALKYFILKIDPKKNMTFNPKESIDFNGNTGPFIQYTHARIKSVLRKATEQNIDFQNVSIDKNLEINEKEKYLIQLLAEFSNVVRQAGQDFSPALIANYTYDLVKEYNQFYHDYSILNERNDCLKVFRLVLSQNIAKTIKTGMSLLGIEMPERM
ncbi:MAG: arginine--tRNA ligase [Prevotellaceae bacterium]|jgi:arginyl-tRNA synthetase|nr:arginine--tRNA ligase [Prevotellaceae bacterium]